MKSLIKYASLLLAAAVLFSCRGNEDDPTGNGGIPEIPADAKLVLATDKTYIQTYDGDFATLTVTLAGKPLTEGVVFMDGNNKVVELDAFKFSTTKEGKYEFRATYGTFISEKISITALSVPIPESPADPKPSGKDFKARVLVTEFTTVGCQWCPQMKTNLHDALEDETLADKVVLTACHASILEGIPDPCFIKTGYDEFAAFEGPPYVFCDMYSGFPLYRQWTGANVAGVFNELYDSKSQVAAGIAVNSTYEDGKIVARVNVKASVEGTYRVGAFLLEDGIYAEQQNADEDWMHTHDGVIRYIDSQYYTGAAEQYYGHALGTIESGETVDFVFAWDIEEIWAQGSRNCELYGGSIPWDERVDENLHLAVFVSSIAADDRGNEFYYVNNVIDCPVSGITQFEYR